MELLTLKYLILLVMLIVQGCAESTSNNINSADVSDIATYNFRNPGSDGQSHLIPEMGNNNTRNVNQAGKVETALVARTDSNQSRAKPVNVLLILQNAVNLREKISRVILNNFANPQTFHTRTLIKFLRI